NNKAKFIVEARKHLNIKDKIKKVVKQKGQQDGQSGAREWLVKNIKGLGYKEASHFLRNVGYFDVAILDRHVLNLMYEDGVIKEIPKTLSKKKYLEIENKFLQLASKLGMSPAELDLYLWSMKTGVVLK
ncbi:N-glycosylase, partial [Candidatus Woesearchaeota archaeon]|nr:N-glycosylase [Candidatus Woesearchaeota archaeon]